MNTSPFSTTFRATSRLASITILVALALSGCGGNSATSPGSGGEPSADMAPSFPAMSGTAQTWTDEGAVHLTIPAASGGDGALSYAATGLPAGVSFDPVSRTLSGTPEAAGSGTITITVTDTDADGRHDRDTYTIAWMVRPSLMVGSGLHRSEAEPAYADAGGETLANHLDDGTTFAPLTSTLTQTWGDAPSTSVSSTGWHVREIQDDGQGGFRVTYASDNDPPRTIHFTDVVDEYGTLGWTDGEGNQIWFYVWDLGYRYFDTVTSGGLGERFWFVFGVRTPESALPAGSATYRGRLRADARSADSPENSQRQRIYGDMRIVANFDLETLMGDVVGIQGTEPGEPPESRSAWSTSSFTITDGRMVDGQFTATITGHDSDPSASPAQSVAGYVGSLLGEFYGPGANEIGAVLTATRDLTGSDHDRVLQGYVGGTKKSFMDLEPFSTGVDRHDLSTSLRIVSQNDDNRVTAVAFDGDSEYRIAYLVDGEPRSVTLDDSHLGGFMSDPDAYWRREGSVGHYFNPDDVNEYVSRGFWVHARYPDDNAADSDPEFGMFGDVVYGQRTAPGSMPGSGTATYSGDAHALAWSPSPASAMVRDTPSYRGMLHLTADFAADSVAGRIDSLRRQETDDDPYMPISDQFEIDNGMIQSNGFSGDLSGLGYTGTVEGGFFGPAASEVGGVLEATGSNGEMLHGSFTGRRQ